MNMNMKNEGLLDARIPDEFYRFVVRMYRARAQIWFIVSVVLLSLTCGFVVAGVGLFYAGDSSKTLRAESELKNQRELEKVQSEINRLSESSDVVYGNQVIYEKAGVLTERLKALERLSRNQFRNEQAEDDAAVIRTADKILNAVTATADTASPRDLILDLSRFGSTTATAEVFGAEILALVRREGVSLGIDWSRATAASARIAALLEEPSGQHADVLNPHLQTAQTHFERFGQLDSSIDAKRANADNEAKVWAADFSSREINRQRLREREQERKDALEASVADRNYVLFMAWVPDLTVRVGAVILLLFVTKILLSTYRYTASLSAFYTGVADAVQLLQPGGSGLWYDISHLNALLAGLVPAKLSIESMETPSETLAGLAKEWIARK
jgi:hypothetical protein